VDDAQLAVMHGIMVLRAPSGNEAPSGQICECGLRQLEGVVVDPVSHEELQVRAMGGAQRSAWNLDTPPLRMRYVGWRGVPDAVASIASLPMNSGSTTCQLKHGPEDGES